MIVKYLGSDGESDLVQEYIQSIVHNQISLDPSQLFALDVIGLHWGNHLGHPPLVDVDIVEPSIDNTTGPYHTPPLTGETEQSLNTQNATPFASPAIIIPVVTGVVLLVLWIGFYLYARNQRRQNGKTASVLQASKECQEDIETGSVTTAPTISPTNSGPEYDSDFNTPDGKTAPARNDRSSEGFKKPVRRRGPVSVDSPDRKSLPVSVDSPDRSAAGLPPRPPRRNSTKLKTNRRKKKKKVKKVVALKRVNSREGINEMPMISESDEDSELGSECDSECTSDDGSSYDASSGCLTPARSRSRSRSRTSSRASSPQLSPRDEMFASDAFDHDVEFLIEAPDFPNLLDGKGAGTNFEKSDLMPPHLDRKSKTPSDDKIENSVKNRPKALEIESRTADESMNEDNTSPKRRLPLPWLD